MVPASADKIVPGGSPRPARTGRDDGHVLRQPESIHMLLAGASSRPMSSDCPMPGHAVLARTCERPRNSPARIVMRTDTAGGIEHGRRRRPAVTTFSTASRARPTGAPSGQPRHDSEHGRRSPETKRGDEREPPPPRRRWRGHSPLLGGSLARRL